MISIVQTSAPWGPQNDDEDDFTDEESESVMPGKAPLKF